jgi:hypothetical protein
VTYDEDMIIEALCRYFVVYVGHLGGALRLVSAPRTAETTADGGVDVSERDGVMSTRAARR